LDNSGLNDKTSSRLKVYTRRGDHGETSLCDGSRTSKDSERVEAFGSLDELNSYLGLCIVKLEHKDIKEHLMQIQKEVHGISANIAFPANLSQSIIKGQSIADQIPRMSDYKIKKLEDWIDIYENELPELKHFILAGGNEGSAYLHIARTVCRRAERQVVRLKQNEEIDKNLLIYLNRLSDYLFTAARLVSHRAGRDDVKWRSEI